MNNERIFLEQKRNRKMIEIFDYNTLWTEQLNGLKVFFVETVWNKKKRKNPIILNIFEYNQFFSFVFILWSNKSADYELHNVFTLAQTVSGSNIINIPRFVNAFELNIIASKHVSVRKRTEWRGKTSTIRYQHNNNRQFTQTLTHTQSHVKCNTNKSQSVNRNVNDFDVLNTSWLCRAMLFIHTCILYSFRQTANQSHHLGSSKEMIICFSDI